MTACRSIGARADLYPAPQTAVLLSNFGVRLLLFPFVYFPTITFFIFIFSWQAKIMGSGPELTFQIAPHAIEDLGSNLYSGFPRVLAEFVANAYDADASKVDISFDFEKVKMVRNQMRKAYQRELSEEGEAEPLAERRLPSHIAVEIRATTGRTNRPDVSVQNRVLAIQLICGARCRLKLDGKDNIESDFLESEPQKASSGEKVDDSRFGSHFPLQVLQAFDYDRNFRWA